MTGAGRALFVPLSLAVGFAMVASYLLSSTLVPVLSVWLLRGHPTEAPRKAGAFRRFGNRLRGPSSVAWSGDAACSSSSISSPAPPSFSPAGRAPRHRDLPERRRGQFQLRLRGAAGTRIERTENITHDGPGRDRRRGGQGERREHPRLRRRPAAELPDQHHLPLDERPRGSVLQVQLKPGTRIGSSPEGAAARAFRPGQCRACVSRSSRATS